MIQHYTIYNTATGEIVKTLSVDDTLLEANYVAGTQDWIAGAYDAREYYVSGGAATPRPANTATADKSEIVADGVDALTISSIPAGTQATILGPTMSSITVDDGQLVITVEVPGDYVVSLVSFPEVDAEVTFVAT